MDCRLECGACCIMPSISSSIPGMPEGKPAGIRCIHLSEKLECLIFDSPERPKVCSNFKPELMFCGTCATEAMHILASLENLVLDNNKFLSSNN